MSDGRTTTAPEATPTRRVPGAVRRGLIAAGLAMARSGGPDAVVLREAVRRVGVAPNAAYRHFADRDALLNAVCLAAMHELAHRMETEIARVAAPHGTREGAQARLAAVGVAYLDFATAEPGLFETAFAVPRHLEYATGERAAGEERTPLQLLQGVLDELVEAGVLPPERRPGAEYAVWASVHGMAMLISQGPLRQLPQSEKDRLISLHFAFIGRGLLE
jgi:AcrR family transcriptional regulator